MTSHFRRALVALSLLLLAGSSSASAQSGAESDYPRLDDALQLPEREPVLLIVEGLEPLVEPAALRASLAALFGRPVVSLSEAGAGAALATLYCSRPDARAPAARRAFITLRLSTQGVDLWRRIAVNSLGGDAAGAITEAVIDMLWSDRIASLADPELLDPFCPPGLTCVDGERPSWRLHAAPRAAERALVDPWDARDPRFTLLESRPYWRRGDPWGVPAARPAKSAPRAAPGSDGGVSERSRRAD